MNRTHSVRLLKGEVLSLHVRAAAVLVPLWALSGCVEDKVARVVPAVEYTQAVHDGTAEKFSFFDIALKRQEEQELAEKMKEQGDARAKLAAAAETPVGTKVQALTPPSGDPKFTQQGLELKKSLKAPETEASKMIEREYAAMVAKLPPAPPPGSSSPYYNGQMTANPSLWPDESQGGSLFRDLRAFQPMDVVTIVINEAVEGQKRTQTDSQSRFTFLAAIENLFSFLGDGTGADTAKWVSNNAGLDPENLINAQTNSVYQGTGQTRRLGSLRGKLSAMVLEVLPNGLLRIEGTKIVAVDHEEEVMVVSGLARLRDIDSQNQLDSARIANMRIDFYGKGVVGDVTELGWGTRLLRKVWPF